MKFITETINDFLHLFYPHNCIGCNTDQLKNHELLCTHCTHILPFTHFLEFSGNLVEKTFYGRLPVAEAAALLYFTKSSIVQNLLFELKYRGNIEAGLFLGRLTGRALTSSSRFKDVDLLVPMPLNEKKLKKRGYNQAEIIMKGMMEEVSIPADTKSVIRSVFTETQTGKGRVDRWKSMEGAFMVTNAAALSNKHILIIDDVVTTGATIEAMANTILAATDCRISVLTVAWTT
jgi:ComF family protein